MERTPSTLKLAWIMLKKMAGIPTATADTEGQLRYTRDGNVTGAFKMFRHIAGATYDSQEIVGTTATQTLTNKTFTAPTMADFTNANHDHLDADDGGTLTSAAISDFATAVDERARDAVGTALTAGNHITITPNDPGDTITLALDSPLADADVTIQRSSTTAFVVEDHLGTDNFKIDTSGEWVQLANGTKLAGYSDNYSTETFQIQAATGNAQFDGTVTATAVDLTTPVSLADGGTGESLADPGADRILFWDDSAGDVTWLTAGTGLAITGTSLDVTAAPGAGITVAEGGVNLDTDIGTLDFDASDFTLTESPENTAVITLAYGTSAGTPAEGNHTHSVALNDLSDVVISSPAANQVVSHDGTDWDNRYPNVYATFGPYHLNDVPGTATTEMLLLYMTAATTVAQGTTGASSENDLRMPAAGRVVAAWLNTDSARTAGSATLQVRINNVATAFESGAVALDATNTIRDSAISNTGLAFSSGDRLGLALVTSSWTPTTADATAWFTVRFDHV